ncbi:MAG: hypothetical protein AAFN63_01925 [Pseudomonadota bacterium]
MTYFLLTTQRLYETCKVMHWLFSQHDNCADQPHPTPRPFSKRSRDHLMLVLRAQWYGFDRNETIYLVQLFDETQGAIKD